MKILLHNEYKIINWWYPTYVYQFFNFLIITKIECWPVFKHPPLINIWDDPNDGMSRTQEQLVHRFWFIIVNGLLLVECEWFIIIIIIWFIIVIQK